MKNMKKTMRKIVVVLIIVIVVMAIALGISIRSAVIANYEKEKSQEVSVDAIKEELAEISEYSVYEHNYETVLVFSDKNKIKALNIPFTGNRFIATIEGTMRIGIDAEELQLEKKTTAEGTVEEVRIIVPHAKILSNDPHPESLEIIDEKHVVTNPVTPKDYNSLLVEAKETQAEKVYNSDILQKANERVQFLLETHLYAIYGENVEIVFSFIEENE